MTPKNITHEKILNFHQVSFLLFGFHIYGPGQTVWAFLSLAELDANWMSFWLQTDIECPFQKRVSAVCSMSYKEPTKDLTKYKRPKWKEMPAKNDVFFSAASCKKTNQKWCSPSYFVTTLAHRRTLEWPHLNS